MYQVSGPLGHRGAVTCNNFILWSLDPSGGDTWVERKAVGAGRWNPNLGGSRGSSENRRYLLKVSKKRGEAQFGKGKGVWPPGQVKGTLGNEGAASLAAF